LTVGDGLLGQVVVDDNSVLAVVTEPLTHGAASERSDVLQRRSLGGGGGNNDAVLHGIILLKSLDKLGDSGTLLTNGDVDAVKLLGLVVAIVPPLLVQHGVQSDSGLTSLTIADDQLTLATTDRHHGVDGLETGLHRLVDRLAGQNTRSLDLGTALLGGLDRALAVNGVTESVDNTAEQGLADRNIDLAVVSMFTFVMARTSQALVDVQSRRYA